MKRECSSLECRHDIFTTIFAYEGGGFMDYRLMSFDCVEIIHDARSTIIDAPFDADN
jgi:hypothetical protein